MVPGYDARMGTNTTTAAKVPTGQAAMLIRRPVADVFEAFIDPKITSEFWFTRGSGRLEPGADVRWDWEMFDVSTTVHVKKIERNERIVIEWESYGNVTTTVEWRFTPRTDATFVSVTESGFRGDDIAGHAIDSTGGFTLVLAGLKALLEHGVRLNLVQDRFPDGTPGDADGGR
jgi:uncharacterized protein YndB with AHSA1/START domain